MKVTVKKGTKTWFVEGDPPVAEFVQDTPVEVEGPRGEWYITVGDITGFPKGAQAYLTEDMFEREE